MTVSEQIIQVLDALCQKFGMVIDWTSANIMPYLEELCGRYIQYEVFTSIAWIVIMLVLVLLTTIPLSITHKQAARVEWDTCYAAPYVATALWILLVVISLISLAVICGQVFDIIECCTLPEKVIFEYVRSLMKSTSY